MTNIEFAAVSYTLLGVLFAATAPVEAKGQEVLVFRFLFWPAVLAHHAYKLATRR